MRFREVLRSLLPDTGVEVVSAAWLKEHARRGERTKGHDGPPMTFPIQKQRNEAAGFNRYLLRKRA